MIKLIKVKLINDFFVDDNIFEYKYKILKIIKAMIFVK